MDTIHLLPPQDLAPAPPPTPPNPPPEVIKPQPGEPTPKPEKKPKKGLILTILAALIVISGLITAVLYAQTGSLQNLLEAQNLSKLLPFLPQTTPTPSSSPALTPEPADPTTNWQTYEDSLFNLTFKYPTGWILETDKKGMNILLKPANQSEQFPSIGIYALDNSQNLTVKEYDEEMSKDGPNPGLYSRFVANKEIIAEEMVVSGIKGYFQKETGCEPLPCSIFALSYNKKIYVAQVIYPGERNEQIGNVFNQILSTFKFTSQDNGIVGNYLQTNLEQLARARDQQRKSDLQSLINALYQYSIDHDGILPSGFPSQSTCIGTDSVCYDLAAQNNFVPTYLDSMRLDPSTGNLHNTYYLVYQTIDGRVSLEATGEIESPIILTQ